MSAPPLPYGWVQETDPTHNHPYYVDTKANPPRSTWVHPFEDEQYLRDHPEAREKVSKRHSGVGEYKPPPGPPDDNRRHSYAGQSSSGVTEKPGPSSNKKKQGLFSKLKDKAIGTKEEREAEKRQHAELQRQRQQQMAALQQQRQQQLLQMQQQRQQQFGGGYGGSQMYSSPAGAPYGGGGMMGGGGGMMGGRRGGMGGMGLPLVGGLAGGLLLGDMLGGDGGDGGDFGGDGGGDFGGGDFGGGGDF